MREWKIPAFVYRWGASVFAVLLFFGMSYMYRYGDKELYEYILRSYGVLPFRFPFVDISALLSAWECARHGVDVILSNPCDVLHRPFDYSPLWMAASATPLGAGDTMAVGWGLDLIFLLSLGLLPPPRRLLELVLVLAATLSTMVVFAVERANADLLMFLLALAAGLLTKYRLPMRLFGYLLGLVAALVKYYPIMILLVAFRERLSIFCMGSLATVGSLAVFWVAYHVEIVRGLPGISRGPYNTDLFSTQNLPYLLGEVVGNSADSPLAERIVTGGLYAIMVVACVALCRKLGRSVELRAALASLPRLDRVLLVIGSAVIAGCFFAGQSIGYRGVFLLLVMPGLLTLSRAFTREVRVLALGASVVIVLLMWGECFRLALWDSELRIQFWLLRELCWWWIVSVMLAVIGDFLADSPIGRSVSSLLDRSPARAR